MRMALVVALLCFSGVGSADPVKTVDVSRLTLGDVLDALPAEVAALDLGPAPQPGGSRLVSRDEIERTLAEHGMSSVAIKMPGSVRVVGAAKRVSPPELARLAEPSVRAALPEGVEYVKLEAGSEVTLSPRARVEKVELGRFPRRAGTQRASAILVFGGDGGISFRLPATVVGVVSDEAARPDVSRNGRLLLVLQRGAMRVAADGAALADASVGETLPVRVSATGRVVRARIISASEAELLESP